MFIFRKKENKQGYELEPDFVYIMKWFIGGFIIGMYLAWIWG